MTAKPIPLARDWIAAYLWELDYNGVLKDQPALVRTKYSADAEKFMKEDDLSRALQASGWHEGYRAAKAGAQITDNPHLPIDIEQATPYKTP